ncbi:pkd2 [Symbiodinium natans]|uniref:Pkd2 protein n=1 Tax=Symbiodinium natans TaxID=878477 RepID=A0A812J445_9DINO|nr:pkd2 [Symbiodinium natans]
MDDPDIPQLSVETKILLQKLKIWDKIANGNLHNITLADVQAVFDILDPGEKGYITRSECFALTQVQNVKVSQQYLQDLCEDADKDNSGTVSADEFLKALTTGQVAFNFLKESLGKGPKEMKQNECDRADLLAWLKEEYETTSALYSMPTVFFLLLSYIYFITTHVDTTSAWRTGNTLFNNLDTLWKATKVANRKGAMQHMQWTLDQWVSKYFRQDLVSDPFPGRVAIYNQVIGGPRLHKEFLQEGPCAASEDNSFLFNSLTGRCDRHGVKTDEDIVLPYHLDRTLHERTIRNLTESFWFDYKTELVEYQTIFYNAQLNLVTFERLQWNAQTDGYIQLYFRFESWIAEPYKNPWAVIPDILFVALLLRIAHVEAKELLPAIAGGIDGIRDYLGFWNVVDWLAILTGLFNVGMWFYVLVQMSVRLPAAIAEIPQAALDARVLRNMTYLGLEELAEVVDPRDLNVNINRMFVVAREVYDWHLLLRACFFGYFFILILKFFKSFQANPRLDVVVQTIVHCSVNVAHFAIVFFAIFCSYAFAGHFLLGHKIKGWSTMLGSLFMCWSSSLNADMVQDFSIPVQVVCFVWTLTYQVLVQQVMLNMLYCIVFDSYYSIKGASGKPLTLFQQIKGAAATARETRGFVEMWILIVQLEDDDFPAHPAEVVTVRSLKRAFERYGMSRINAEYLVKQTADSVKERTQQVDITLSDAIRVTGHIQNTMLKNLDLAEESLEMIKTEARNKEAAEKQQQRSAFVSNNMADMPGFDAKQGMTMSESQWRVSDEVCDAVEITLRNISSMLDACRQEQTDLAGDVNNALQQIWHEEDRRYKELDILLHDLEHGLQAVERSIGSMGVSFSGTNFQQLASVPERLDDPDLMQLLCSGEERGGACVERLDRKLSDLKQQMHELSGKASDTAELQQLFWKVEILLRKMNDGKGVIPMKCFIREQPKVEKQARPVSRESD